MGSQFVAERGFDVASFPNGVTSLPFWTCEQCGAQFPESGEPPMSCPVCEDERQFVNWKGQAWLTREELTKHHKLIWREDLGIPGIGMEPSFAIGQRALLVREGDGCVLWDCVPLATSEAVEHVRSLGGLKAIAVSHPHFYGAVADWSEAFGTARSPTGARFSAVCRSICMAMIANGSRGRTRRSFRGWVKAIGCPMTLFLSVPADILPAAPSCIGARLRKGAVVAMDRRSLSFMYSYPNYIPLNTKSVRRIARAVAPLAFDRIYGAWWGRNIGADAKAAFDASVQRYIAAISDAPQHK